MVEQLNTTIRFTDEELAKAREFARSTAGGQTFNRRGVSPEDHERDILVGKLGEIAFAKFLVENGKSLLGNEDMFTVWASPHDADKRDFQTRDGRNIDIKTASESNHRNIFVPQDQLENQPKPFYVGVRIAEDRRSATIVGFTTLAEIHSKGLSPLARFYPAYGYPLAELTPIQQLLELMPEAA